jgi:hypothetical protein
MGSTLGTIRALFESQLGLEQTNSSSDPSSSLINDYINKSIRRIARRDKPRELESAAPSTGDIVVNTNTVSIPSDILVPTIVYYKRSGGSIMRMIYREMKQMVELTGPNTFFDSTKTGDPAYYSTRGTSFVFNKHFSRTETAAINVYGVLFPTTLSIDSDTTELPVDYDLLIVYEAAILFNQREDDRENQVKYQNLAKIERDSLELSLDTDEEAYISMDPNTFTGNTYTYRNPSVFFTS